MKFRSVVPPRCRCSSAICLTFKHNPKGVRTTVFQCADTGCQAVACRTSDDQCFFCSVYHSLFTGVICLVAHTLCTSLRMCGCADIFSYFWLDDHNFSPWIYFFAWYFLVKRIKSSASLLVHNRITAPQYIRLNCMYCKYFESQNIIAKKKQNVK